jgi:hypothetical protein
VYRTAHLPTREEALEGAQLPKQSRVELRPMCSEEGQTLVERHKEVGHRFLWGRSDAVHGPEVVLSDELPASVVDDGNG